MNKKILTITTIGFAGLMSMQEAAAHVLYYDIINNPATTITTHGAVTTYQGGDIVSGNFGWADASDFSWGDSHNGSWISFEISDPAGSFIDLTVASDGINEFFNGSSVPTRKGDLNPGFTLYKGLVPDESHDLYSPVPGGKEGAWRSLTDMTMGNEAGETTSINYLAHAGEVDGSASSVSLLNYFLDPGDYTVSIGGACYSCGAADPFPSDTVSRGYLAELTVSPVPVPAALWLLGSGLVCLLGMKKSSQTV